MPITNINADHHFQFDLVRMSGKNIYLYKGNEMVSANDRIHHAPKRFLVSHLREIGKDVGDQYRKELGLKKGYPIYSEYKPCHVLVKVNPPSNRQMDAPNWYPTIKAIMDGLTDAEIFHDDNDTVVKSLTFIPGEKTSSGKYEIGLSLVNGVPPLRLEQLTIDDVIEKADD